LDTFIHRTRLPILHCHHLNSVLRVPGHTFTFWFTQFGHYHVASFAFHTIPTPHIYAHLRLPLWFVRVRFSFTFTFTLPSSLWDHRCRLPHHKFRSHDYTFSHGSQFTFTCFAFPFAFSVYFHTLLYVTHAILGSTTVCSGFHLTTTFRCTRFLLVCARSASHTLHTFTCHCYMRYCYALPVHGYTWFWFGTHWFGYISFLFSLSLHPFYMYTHHTTRTFLYTVPTHTLFTPYLAYILFPFTTPHTATWFTFGYHTLLGSPRLPHTRLNCSLPVISLYIVTVITFGYGCPTPAFPLPLCLPSRTRLHVWALFLCRTFGFVHVYIYTGLVSCLFANTHILAFWSRTPVGYVVIWFTGTLHLPFDTPLHSVCSTVVRYHVHTRLDIF